MGESVLLNDVHVSGRNSTTGVYIVTEVGACHRLERLRLTEIGVAAGNGSTGVYVADE